MSTPVRLAKYVADLAHCSRIEAEQYIKNGWVSVDGRVSEDPAQPVLIICNTQNRSSKVVQAMREAGWTNVRYVHGGMSTWAKNGWPMIKPFGLPAS